MHLLDYGILAAYLIVLVGKSLLLAKKAAGGSDDYFLAGKKMPWWALGASGMSSNLDAAGTMTIIALIYTYGLHGFFIEMRGGVVLPIAVFLAFMGKWHQRSNVVTTGEWMHLRFGTAAPGKAARFTAAVTYLIVTVGMIVFFLAAAGPFLAAIVPWSATQCQVVMALAALMYTMISGLYGVIWTDVVQAGLIAFAAVYVAVLATGYVDADLLAQWPGATYNQAIPELISGLGNPVDGQTYYAPFLLFLLFWAGKGILEGLGGSGGSAYMAQRFYASQDIPTVKKLCMLWTVLFAFRWPMVLGFAILAIHLGVGRDNPEVILNRVLMSDLFPIGIRGLLVTAIFAASMSTFDSTINAGASYVVRDIWLPLRRGSSPRQQVLVGYVASALIVAAGLAIALSIPEGVVRVWVTIVVQFFPAFLLPFALRWFWSRFNGWGFTAGVASGFGAAVGLLFIPGPEALGLPSELSVLIQNDAFTDVFILGSVGLASLIGCLLGTFATAEVDEPTLRAFYRQIRPLGLWPSEWKRPDAAEHRGDIRRLVVAVVWQISTFLLPMCAMLRMWSATSVLGVVWLVTGLILLRDVQDGGPDAALSGGRV